jgi:hypothetical protein
MENTTTLNREGWLTEFATRVAPIIESRTGLKVPMDKIRVSCSFPRTRATPNRKGGYTTGVCMHGDGHKSGLHELFINPLKANVLPVRDGDQGVGDILIHEILHASLPVKTGHKAAFARAAKAMGLEGKPTATTAGPEAIKIIESITEQIGQDYPHEALDGQWGRKQGTRLLKVQCIDCGYTNEQGNGYTARITMTWLEIGLPTCPCGQTMSLVEKGMEDDIVVLKPVDSSATYRVPTEDGKDYDDRFQIRRVTSEHFGERWSVIDFGAPTIRLHEVDGEVQEVAVPNLNEQQARIVAADSKLNALELIDAVRTGLFTWDEHEGLHADAIIEGEDDLDTDEDDYADEFKRGLFHDVDEDETPDHPEDQTPERHVLRMRKYGEWVEREVEFDYDAVASSREG